MIAPRSETRARIRKRRDEGWLRAVAERFGIFGVALLAAVPVDAVSIGRERVTTETHHFLITVDRHKLDAAMDAGEWLEDAWTAQAAFYAFEPSEKIQVALLDEDDVSNGYAYAVNSWIVLHLPPSRFMLRGASQWMPNVAAHELAHVFTLRKMGVTSRFLGVEAFTSWGLRRSRGRADAATAWIPDDVPAWLAEGLAQYGAMHGGRDTLDSRRRMMLRTAWRTGTLPSLKAMEDFSGDARDGEMIYNAGFHFTEYLYRVHGRDAVNAMMDAWERHGYHGAFARAFGSPPEELHARWRTELDARFARDGVEPAEPEPPVTPEDVAYAVETSPVFDTARGVLYVLSSRANDYGILHLYAREPGSEGKGRLIHHDVTPPLNPADGGTLLFAARRVDPRTGARRSDLHRYDPRTGNMTRVTRDRRVFAGADAGGRTYALLHDAGRTRLARLSRDGVPEAWANPPAGSEFSSLAPGDDSTLYATIARGLHADILRFDTRTGTLSPAEASPASETDPHVSGGRLYFVSDRSGEPAVYARSGDTLFRRTPPGTAAFSPFVRNGTMHYAAYGPAGFRIRSVPLEVASAVEAPADTSGATHEAPPPVRIRNLREDRTHMDLLGYYATFGYARTPHADVYGSLAGSGDRAFRLNPCGHQAFAGGGLLASDPASRHLLTGAFLAGRCLDPAATGPGRTYLPAALLGYVNDNMTPLLIAQTGYQGEPVSDPETDPDRIGRIHSFRTMVAARYDLAYSVSATPFAFVGATVLHLPGSPRSTEGGGGLAAGGTLGLTLLEPGADFVNEGVYADLTAAATTGAILFSGTGGIHGHVQRTLFLGLRGDMTGAGGDDAARDAGLDATADLRIPLETTFGGAGYRGLHLESLFLHAGYVVRSRSFSGITLSHAGLADGLRAASLRDLRHGAAPVAQIREVSSQMMGFGVRLKVLTPGSRVAFWSLRWEAPVADTNDGSVSLSLVL